MNNVESTKILQLHIPRASLSCSISSSSTRSPSREFSSELKISEGFSNECKTFGKSTNQLKSLDCYPILYGSKNISPPSCNNQQKYLVRKAPKPSSLHSLSSASSSLSTGGSDQSNYVS